MALSLTVPSDYGVAATYHRIGAVQINWLDRGATVVLFSYISNEARQNGKQPLGTVNITFSDADFEFDNDEPTRAALYAKIKQQGAWSDASDA